MQERLNSGIATDAVVLQAAIHSVLDQKAAKHFSKLVKGLQNA